MPLYLLRYTEKFSRGTELHTLVNALSQQTNLLPSALMGIEIGGLNSIEPLLASADLSIPTVDGDGMGRAFPAFHMFSPFIYGLDVVPVAMCDDQLRIKIFNDKGEVPDSAKLEEVCRNTVIEMGCAAGIGAPPITVEQANQWAVKVNKYTYRYILD